MATTTEEPKWTQDEITRACHATRWQRKDWVTWSEITMPGSSRRIDLLAIARWRSRGYARIGVEIKCQRSDLLNELKDPGKSDATWRFVDEFWFATPPGLVGADLKSEFEELGWGVIEFKRTDGKHGPGWRSKTVVKPKPAGGEAWPTELWMRICMRDEESVERDLQQRIARIRGDLQRDYAKRLEQQTVPFDTKQRLARLDEFEAELGFSISDWQGVKGVPTHALPKRIRELHEMAQVDKDLGTMRDAIQTNIDRWQKAMDELNQEDHDSEQ